MKKRTAQKATCTFSFHSLAARSLSSCSLAAAARRRRTSCHSPLSSGAEEDSMEDMGFSSRPASESSSLSLSAALSSCGLLGPSASGPLLSPLAAVSTPTASQATKQQTPPTPFPLIYWCTPPHGWSTDPPAPPTPQFSTDDWSTDWWPSTRPQTLFTDDQNGQG